MDRVDLPEGGFFNYSAQPCYDNTTEIKQGAIKLTSLSLWYIEF